MGFNTTPFNPFPASTDQKGGGGSSYVLPAATDDTLGGIKVGDNLTVEEDGTLNAEDPYTLPAATDETLGGIIVGDDLNIGSGGVLDVLCTIPILDNYKLSVNNENGFVIKKTHNGVETTTTYTSGLYDTYTIDNLFTLTYDGNWIITLLVASTEYPAETTWSSGYMEQPTISELDFVVGSRTGTASSFLTELFYR